MVLRPQVVAELEDYFDLALQTGVSEVRFIPLRRIGAGSEAQTEVPQLHHVLTRLVSILNRRPELARLLGRDFFSILMTVCRFSCLRDNCGIGRRCLFINADGNLFPCPNHVAAAMVLRKCPDYAAGGLIGAVDDSALHARNLLPGPHDGVP